MNGEIVLQRFLTESLTTSENTDFREEFDGFGEILDPNSLY